MTPQERVTSTFSRITQWRLWNRLVEGYRGFPRLKEQQLPITPPTSAFRPRVLLTGRGRQDLPPEAVEFVATVLGQTCEVLSSRFSGNPGAVLTTLQRERQLRPSIRLYQPAHMRCCWQSGCFGGKPITFIGRPLQPTQKQEFDARWQAISDAHVILALGGTRSALLDVLLGMEANKRIVLIRRYGPVPACLHHNRRLRQYPNLHFCNNLTDAVATVIATAEA